MRRLSKKIRPTENNLLEIPNQSGAYLLCRGKKPPYVGNAEAGNLQKRIRQQLKIKRGITTIRYKPTSSEKEAIIWGKKYRDKYNPRQRDIPKSKLMPEKRRVFVSFHHKNDQRWFDYFTNKFSDEYEIFIDKSISDKKVRSDDPKYINRAIREDHIKGSSTTIVLYGVETWKRKYIDWEIYSTLHYEHALLGIALPTIRKTPNKKIIVPARLHYNIQTGYAHFINWTKDAAKLKKAIEIAIMRSKNKNLIENSQEKMKRNRS